MTHEQASVIATLLGAIFTMNLVVTAIIVAAYVAWLTSGRKK